MKDGRSAILRPASPDDAAATVDLVNSVAADKKLLMSERAPFTVEEERKTLKEGPRRNHAFFVAEVSGRLIGLMDVRRGEWEKNAHVGNLGISLLPEYRGLDLGSALMHVGIEWARVAGIRKLTLGVFATNERAIALYEKLGFVEEARLKGQVILDGMPVDEILMALWL